MLLRSDSQTSIELALLLLRFDSLQISIDFFNVTLCAFLYDQKNYWLEKNLGKIVLVDKLAKVLKQR